MNDTINRAETRYPISHRPVPWEGLPSEVHPMQLLIDKLLEERAPKVELADGSVDTTPRALEQVQVMLAAGMVAGVLAETVIPGVYRMMSPGKNGAGAQTMVEIFFSADQVVSIMIERADIAEMARRAMRQGGDGGGKSAIWTP